MIKEITYILTICEPKKESTLVEYKANLAFPTITKGEFIKISDKDVVNDDVLTVRAAKIEHKISRIKKSLIFHTIVSTDNGN